MTLGSLLLGFVYYAAAFLCLTAFNSKKKRPDTQGVLRSHVSAVRSFLWAVVERRTRLPERARAAAPWFLLAVFLLVLGFVRQLNLQLWLTERFQTEAIIEGWYETRRVEQLGFIRGVVVALAIAIGAMMILLRKRMADVGLAFMGAMILPALLLVRAASHHGIDELLLTPVLGLRLAYWIEGGALALIAGRALLSVRRARAPVQASGPIVARIDRVDPS